MTESAAGFGGKVAFITGGAIGFGRAFARALGQRGAAVVLGDVDAPAAERTAAELRADGIRSLAVSCDVGDQATVDQAVTAASREFGGIDLLINNAGRHLKKYNQPFSSLTIDEIRGVFDVNVMGIIYCSLACRNSMRERGGGCIINMASAAAYMVTTPYAVTKLAVRGLTIAFANEFAADQIRVNAIAPGLTTTESTLAEFSDEHFEAVTQRQLVHRRGSMDDVVQTMLFLSSEQGSFITGETVRVTGGVGLSI